MKITATAQSGIDPANKPMVNFPVSVLADMPVYYSEDKGLTLVKSGIFCSRLFADTVLKVINDHCVEHNLGLVHIGVYNPRPARKKDGTNFIPLRWSEHAYGNAIDLKGFAQSGKLIYTDKEPHFKDLLKKIVDMCASKKVTLSVVNETNWYHIGLKV